MMIWVGVLVFFMVCLLICYNQTMTNNLQYKPWRSRNLPNLYTKQNIPYYDTKDIALKAPNGCAYNSLYLKPSRPIEESDLQNQFTIGFPKARVHMVVFEDLKCPDCKHYVENVYPVIKKRFIDTNLMRYTSIPIAMLPGSSIASMASLCVLNQGDQQFDDYVKYAYQHQQDEHIDWVNNRVTIDFASHIPGLNISTFEKCIVNRQTQKELEHNMNLAYEVMSDHFNTPGIFINNKRILVPTIDNITKLIEDELMTCGWI